MGTHVKLICQQCRSRVSVTEPGVSFMLSKSKPPLKSSPEFGCQVDRSVEVERLCDETM